ncbi:MAG: F0F1 ATP synthase subunit A [Chitinophagales bacterium]|nr:F0F1 ATP synthase subunit A [Chitinophagales bacterium]
MRQIVLVFLLFISANTFAQDTTVVNHASSHEVAVEKLDNIYGEVSHTESAEEESPVDVIMNHVADANIYHIATINGKHITFGLPCILWRNNKLSVFSSSRFHHEEVVDGFTLDHHTGKVVDAATGKRSSDLLSYFGATDSSKFIDFSITKNVFTMLLGVLLLTIAFSMVVRSYKRGANVAPKGFQALFEPIFLYIYEDVIKQNLGKKADKYAPYLLSLFFFILIINLIGLIPFFPGGANASGNISFTAVLAICTFLVITLNGNKHYWHHIFAMPGVPKWVLIILTPVEIAGMFVKPFALAMRLFGNITSGHVVILSLVSLIFILGKNGESLGGAFAGSAMAVPFVLFMSALELLVAFLQAYIFTLLSAIFISSAVAEDEHH